MEDFFSDKVAVVTGGANGIGLACVKELARVGCHVAIADLDMEAAERVAEEMVQNSEVQIIPFAIDVSDSKQCREMIQRVQDQLGSLHILINCAGGSLDKKPILELEESTWHRTLDINLHGTYYCSRAFAEVVIERQGEGSIVNISSIFATRNAPGLAAYCVSKAAVSQLTKAMALEMAEYRIRVNAVGPSHVETGRMKKKIEAGVVDVETVVGHVPMNRMSQSEEVADLVIFLCSDRASFITGQTVVIDGGYTIE